MKRLSMLALLVTTPLALAAVPAESVRAGISFPQEVGSYDDDDYDDDYEDDYDDDDYDDDDWDDDDWDDDDWDD